MANKKPASIKDKASGTSPMKKISSTVTAKSKVADKFKVNKIKKKDK